MEPPGLASPTVHDARERRFGGYLDEYRPGDRYRHWPGKTVTEADDHLFCLLTMAASPLHIDRAYARQKCRAAATSWSAPISIPCCWG